MARRELLWPLGLLIALAGVAHVLLSPLGFNLTDDGFVLAQSRRLLAGEIPHRDFISIRPVGSALLHVFDLLVGGERTFLVSRLFFWLEVAVSCWAWLAIVLKGQAVRPSHWATLPLAALAFLFSTHAFPPMAWYTVDAIMLASLGFLASGSRHGGRAWLGHALIGAAAICKQNFLPLTIAAVILRGRARQPAAWLAAVAAPLLYVLVLTALGAGPAMRVQLTAVTGLFESGVRPYVREGWFAGGAALGALLAWLATRRGPTVLRIAAIAAGCAAVVFAGRALDSESFHFILSEAFLLFGLAAGTLVVPLVRRDFSPALRAGGFAIALAWCAAVSLGYLSPALVCGPLVLVFGLGRLGALGAEDRTAARFASAVCATLTLLLVAPHWWSARRDHIYHEATAPLLTHDLAGVLPGGQGIRTNANTYAMLKELDDTVAGLEGRRYALLVDGPGWWVCAPQRNPLPVDWANGMELPSEPLRGRVTDSVLRQRGQLAVIVQRATGLRSSVGFRPVPLDDPFYGAAAWTVRTLELESGSMYWTVYR
ncbi:MAG: hypothetical protein ABL977_01650 [Candidatus Eisenbacteria bacterium]